jgi:hypothetical protein
MCGLPVLEFSTGMCHSPYALTCGLIHANPVMALPMRHVYRAAARERALTPDEIRQFLKPCSFLRQITLRTSSAVISRTGLLPVSGFDCIAESVCRQKILCLRGLQAH